jgi:hypothetical protein
MENLESIVGNFGKGLATGVTSVVDPIGTLISKIDYTFTGTGYSNEDASPTLHNDVYRAAYNPEEKVSFSRGYLPRALGKLTGVGLVGLGAYTLIASAGIAAPWVLVPGAIYYVIRRLTKPINKNREKASFYDGFKYGWHSGSNFLDFGHELESGLTGRGKSNSRIYSSVRESAKPMRRNFSSIVGSFVGKLTGLVASRFTFYILPTYKCVRDLVKNHKLQENRALQDSSEG